MKTNAWSEGKIERSLLFRYAENAKRKSESPNHRMYVYAAAQLIRIHVGGMSKLSYHWLLASRLLAF